MCWRPSASQRGARALRLLRRARQHQGDRRLPGSGDPALAQGAAAPQPAHSPELGAKPPPRATMAPVSQDHTSLARPAIRRSYPSQEPSALAAHAGICAGGRPSPQGEGRSLPRPSPCCAAGGRHETAAAWRVSDGDRRHRAVARTWPLLRALGIAPSLLLAGDRCASRHTAIDEAALLEPSILATGRKEQPLAFERPTRGSAQSHGYQQSALRCCLTCPGAWCQAAVLGLSVNGPPPPGARGRVGRDRVARGCPALLWSTTLRCSGPATRCLMG